MNSILKKFDLHGRSALVTGAASGIGLAHAEALAEAGAMVTIADIDLTNAKKQAERFENLGWKARAASMDVSDEASVRTAIDDHVAAYGSLHICFANAGVGIGGGWKGPTGERAAEWQIDTHDMDAWQKSVDINMNGVIYTVRHAVRVMKALNIQGSIVATASNACVMTCPIVSTSYMVAKAGVAHFVRNVALELAEYKIRVNTISPGSFVTNISGGVFQDEAVRKAWDQSVPLGRKMAEPESMKPLTLYLASDASEFETGANIFIDGGVSLETKF